MNKNHNRLVPGAVVYWGDIVGDLSDQKDLVEYVSTHGGGSATAEAVWGSISGNLSDQADLMSKLGEYATESWTEEYIARWGFGSDNKVIREEDISEYGFATQSWVEGQGYLSSVPDTFATKEWVSEQGYLNEVPSGYATESWVESQGYLTEHQDLSSYATMSWVEEQGYVIEDGEDPFATESYVNSATMNDVKFVPSGEGFMMYSYFDATGEMGFIVANDDAEKCVVIDGVGMYVASIDSNGDIGSTDQVVTQTWLLHHFTPTVTLSSTLSSYATQSWVTSQGYLSSVPDTFATKEWVSGQGYLTEVPSDYADKSWVHHNYATRSLLSEQISSVYAWIGVQSYATQSWVSSQGYLTSVPSDYATKSYVDGAVQNISAPFIVENFGVADLGEGTKVGYYHYEEEDQGESEPPYVVEYIDPFLAYHIGQYDEVVGGIGGGFLDIDETGGDFNIGKPNANGDFFGGVKLNQYGILGQFTVTEEWIEEGEEGEGYPEYTSHFEPFATQGWISSQGYLNASALSSALSGYATQSYVDSAISGISAPDNCVEYDPDSPLTDTGADVLKREFDSELGITNPLVLGYEKPDSTNYYAVVQEGQEIYWKAYGTDAQTGDLYEAGQERFYHFNDDEFWPVEYRYVDIEGSPCVDGYVDSVNFLVGNANGAEGNFIGLRVDEYGYAGRYEVEGETDPETGDTTFNERFFPYLTEENGGLVNPDEFGNGYLYYQHPDIPDKCGFRIDTPISDVNAHYHVFNVNGDVYYFWPDQDHMMYKLNPYTFQFEEFIETTGHNIEDDYVLWNDDNGNVFYGNEYKVNMETGVFTPFSMGGDYSYAYGRHNIIRWGDDIIMLGESDNIVYFYDADTMQFDTSVELDDDGWWMWLQGCEFNGEYYAYDNNNVRKLAWDSEGSDQWLYFETIGEGDEVDVTEVFPFVFDGGGYTVHVYPQNVHKIIGVDEEYYVLMQLDASCVFRLEYEEGEYVWSPTEVIDGFDFATSGCMGPVPDTVVGRGYTGETYSMTAWNLGSSPVTYEWRDLDSQIGEISTSVNEVTIRVPDILDDSPSDGTYVLKCDVDSGVPTYYWALDTSQNA